ncbi:MAG TPA: hypothetical protein VN909_07080 [Candidatus Dormibacteraeota bacterium]|nr:hypothetical protein [Candidatus Dormibacteraeota bacterium]
MSAFSQEVFTYITTVVPYWRVNDEAWSLESDYLTGIGVERNYGGQVMVMPWGEDTGSQLARFHDRLAPLAKRIIVVVDDREVDDVNRVAAMVTPIAVLAWSRRAELASVIIKDSAD